MSKYTDWVTPENLILVEGWRRDGLSDEQIADNIGVHVSTVYQWRKDHSEFSEAYKKGTEVSTYEVENALYKSALGHFVEEIEMVETTTPMGVNTTKKKHRRYIPPNTAAQIFILKNRRPDWWKDKREFESTSNVANDGFLKALETTASDDWEDEEDDETADNNI
jgi:transcriptional regulator with XRE-family HTH domain